MKKYNKYVALALLHENVKKKIKKRENWTNTIYYLLN